MHSAQWRPEVALNGRRIAVVGTGASAVQLVPEIAPLAARLSLFQRTPPWVLPRLDHRYSAVGRRLTGRFPALQRAFRSAYFGVTELFGVALLRSEPLRRVVERLSRTWLRHQVPDPDLRRRLLPDHELGCKRVLFTSTYLPALSRPNVHLVTEPIREVTPDGIRTADGTEHPADVLVLGTGFATTDLLAPLRIHGLRGRTLDQAWADGAAAYYGLTVPGFPNLFVLYGPNTNLGSGSIVVMLEAQIQYVLDALARIRPGAALDLRPEVLTAFDAEMQRRLAGSVWAGCSSWYRAPNGRMVTNWPGLPSEYARRARFAAADYTALPAAVPTALPAADPTGLQGEAPAVPGTDPAQEPLPASTSASGRGSGEGAQRPSTTA
jgi:cation diffusion facilitator CzcD-associated flavoprotein CzcO